MEHVSEDSPLATDSRTGSQQVLLEPTGTAGTSNSRALKIVGLTVLACLLLSAQVFTAYLVFDQRQQIQGLQATNQRMQKQMGQRSQVAPKKMVIPAGSMPLLDMFNDAAKPPNPTTPKAEPKVELKKADPSVEKDLQEFMKNFTLPHFNQSFLANLQTLKQQVNETSWKSFESWLRYWLLFQMAQKTPTPHPASQARTKCQVEASTGLQSGLLGSFKPQCDEEGNYKSMQCWTSTGKCWCVDENGSPIKGSMTRGPANCGKFLLPSRSASDAIMMPGLIDDK